MTRNGNSILAGVISCLIILGCFVAPTSAAMQATKSKAASKKTDAKETAPPKPPAHRGEFRSILQETAPASASRAWEWRPYQVAVWLCHDGSPEFGVVEQQLCGAVENETAILDPSGWNVKVGTPPSQFRWMFLNSIYEPEKLVKFEEDPELAHYDKLMVVCLRHDSGKAKIEVREFDLRTRQWGPLVSSSIGKRNTLPALITRQISKAFMPLAKVHSLVEDPKTRKDTVLLRTRGVKSCVRTELNEDLELEPMPIRSSPCFVRESDYFLPILRRTDRKGNLIRLEPIDYTFLTIKNVEGAEVSCDVHTAAYSVFSGRSGKKKEKLALVIRPPARSTYLTLVSRGNEPRPMEGFEIYSFKPGDFSSKAKVSDGELIGETDWEGRIEIPPTKPGIEGLRLLGVSRAGRWLRKLPLIPGLHDELQAVLPDDDARLYGEGVIKGLENEILNVVIQRKIYESEIDIAIKAKDRSLASETLRNYKNLETPREIKARLANEEVRLKTMSTNKNEIAYITKMFVTLKKLLDSEVVKTRESELQQKIQQLR